MSSEHSRADATCANSPIARRARDGDGPRHTPPGAEGARRNLQAGDEAAQGSAGRQRHADACPVLAPDAYAAAPARKPASAEPRASSEPRPVPEPRTSTEQRPVHESRPSPPPPSDESVPRGAPTAPSPDAATGWQRVVDEVMKRKPTLAAVLAQSKPGGLRDGELTIVLSGNHFHREMLADTANRRAAAGDPRTWRGWSGSA